MRGQMHSAGKTTVSMLKRDHRLQQRAETDVVAETTTTTMQTPPDAEEPLSPGSTVVAGRSIKRQYGYIMSHIPFGPSIRKTLAAI